MSLLVRLEQNLLVKVWQDFRALNLGDLQEFVVLALCLLFRWLIFYEGGFTAILLRVQALPVVLRGIFLHSDGHCNVQLFVTAQESRVFRHSSLRLFKYEVELVLEVALERDAVVGLLLFFFDGLAVLGLF